MDETIDIAAAMAELAEDKNLPIILLGGAADDDSPAAEMADALRWSGHRFLHTNHLECPVRAVYFIAVEDERYQSYQFARGSVVLDPYEQITDQPGVEKV